VFTGELRGLTGVERSG